MPTLRVQSNLEWQSTDTHKIYPWRSKVVLPILWIYILLHNQDSGITVYRISPWTVHLNSSTIKLLLIMSCMNSPYDGSGTGGSERITGPVLAGGISGQLSLYNYYNFQPARYNLDTWLNQHQPPVSSVGQWKYLNVTRDVGHSPDFTACSLECCMLQSGTDTFHMLWT